MELKAWNGAAEYTTDKMVSKCDYGKKVESYNFETKP